MAPKQKKRKTTSSPSTLEPFRLIVLVMLFLLPLHSIGGGGSLIRNSENVFGSSTHFKGARLTTLTAQNLHPASKAENINGILELAERESRIDTIHMMQLARAFELMPHGDRVLLACLQEEACQPDKFLEIVRASSLHAEIVTRNPSLGMVQVNHAVGALNENLMIRYFEHSGWSRVQGQVGRTGFDGLFVKYDNGTIKDVLIVESKYNTSILQSTNFGVQMSQNWTRRKIEELIAHYPGDDTYPKIEKLILADAYRAVLWNLKVDEDSIRIGLSRVKSKGETVELVTAEGTDIEQLSSPISKTINFGAPSGNFEAKILDWYRDQLTKIENL